MNVIPEVYAFWISVILMGTGFYIVIAHSNLFKKLVGLNIFQTSVFILFISVGNIDGATAPILAEGYDLYSNPLTHVLILTAIVVSVATTAVGLALIVNIERYYDSVDEHEIENMDMEEE